MDEPVQLSTFVSMEMRTEGRKNTEIANCMVLSIASESICTVYISKQICSNI